MIHPGALYKGGWGFVREEKKDLKAQTAMMNIEDNHYADIVSRNSKLTKQEALELLKKTTWFTAQEAKDKYGFVDEIQ